MSRFRVGDIVGRYCSHSINPTYTAEVIAEGREDNVRVVSYPGFEYLIDGVYSVDLTAAYLRLVKPILTKEERFAISKNRVETRHLRKKAK